MEGARTTLTSSSSSQAPSYAYKMLQIAGHVVKWWPEEHSDSLCFKISIFGAENLWNTKLTGHFAGKSYETLPEATDPKLVWLWLERPVSPDSESHVLVGISYPIHNFFPVCSYVFIFARIFPSPCSFYLGCSFFLFSFFHFSSVFGCIIPFMTVLLFPQYLFFILRCLFALPRGAQRPEIQQKTATGWQWRSRDAEVRPSASHRRSVTSQQSIYKQERWKRERVSIPPPGRRLRKETQHMEAHFAPLASPQSPLLLLTVCPKLIERKTT